MAGTEDLIEGVNALEKAAAAYEEGAAYYEGQIPEYFAHEAIRRLVEGTGRGYRFRLAKVPVNVMKNRLRISSIKSGSDTVDTVVQRIREANDMEIQEAHVTERMLVHGDSYVLVWPIPEVGAEEAPEDGDDTAALMDADALDAGVEITYQSPLGCRVLYDAEDGRRARFGIRRWKQKSPLGPRWRAEVWYADRLESWISKPDAKGLDPEDWEPYAEDPTGRRTVATSDNWPQAHDWGQIPIKHARTRLPYGKPEHADAYGPQDAITKAIITQVADIEEHGWPERAALADDAKTLEVGRDAVRWDDDADAPKALSEDITQSRRGPGRIHRFRGTKSVIQFPSPDPGVLVDPVEQWVRLMSAVTETPLYEFDPRIGGDMSGRARDKADAPLRAKEKDRKAYLLRFWREVWDLALAMVGQAAPGPIEINWAPPEVISDGDWWATAQVRQAMGVPPARILGEANYLPEEIEGWLDEQAEEATLDQRIARLAALGDALQKVGAGASLLGIEEQAAPMISKILGEAGGKTLPAGWTPPEPEPAPLPAGDPEDPDGGQPPPAGGGTR